MSKPEEGENHKPPHLHPLHRLARHRHRTRYEADFIGRTDGVFSRAHILVASIALARAPLPFTESGTGLISGPRTP